MRRKTTTQPELSFQPSTLQVTNRYFARYQAISTILEENREIIELVHHDLKKALRSVERSGRGPKCKVTSDTVLRILICQLVEGETLRGIVIRVDDSHFLRWFTRIYNGPMLDFSHLCRLKNAIRPRTWKRVNEVLARYAISEGRIEGERLRLDTTAFETNIHWPTDSSLLWDTYRVLARGIETVRRIDPDLVGDRHLQTRRVKRLVLKIARIAAKKSDRPRERKEVYERLFPLVETILEWAEEIANALRACLRRGPYELLEQAVLEEVVEDLERYRELGARVLDQARRRVLEGESVPNEEKLFSLFEPHTELLKRGKAGKEIEFGHMIAIHQVEQKFITGYDVFRKRPHDSTLTGPALEHHRELFGRMPAVLAGDKGFFGDGSRFDRLAEEVEIVSIPKPGRLAEDERRRERSLAFKLGQQFRAGIEGTISFLKRALGMWRCLNKGWAHYLATVGATVFAHNLLILAREYG